MGSDTSFELKVKLEKDLCWKGMQIVTMKTYRVLCLGKNTNEKPNTGQPRLLIGNEIRSFKSTREVKVNPTVESLKLSQLSNLSSLPRIQRTLKKIRKHALAAKSVRNNMLFQHKTRALRFKAN
jgi:hypothetical protein